MRVFVIRHHQEDSAGFIGEAFQARGAELSVHLLPGDGPLPEPGGFDHVIVLGASGSIYDQGPSSGWIAEEQSWLRRADQAGLPVLGICFGAQALTTLFGGRVGPAGRAEIGWTTIDTLDPGLILAGPWLEFHHDQCHLPPQARLLARNELGVQAFGIGRHLGVQFHPEVDGAQLGRWLDAGSRQEAEDAGVDPGKLLAETIAEEPAARDRAGRLVAAALRLAVTG
jgi:GMP synthase-like glutamine amidotransferase